MRKILYYGCLSLLWGVMVIPPPYAQGAEKERVKESKKHVEEVEVVQQQKKRVNIRVLDASNDMPLAGATIMIKGTTTGVMTDPDGTFSGLSVKETDVLEVSYVGYVAQEIAVKGKTDLEVKLAVDAGVIEDVVVTGFTTQKKESIVASIEAVNPKELKVPSSNFTTSLAGRIPGLISYQRSGEPGRDNAEFFIRGVTTFGYAQSPLILLDGFEVTADDLADVEPDNIENFSILKDATAAALYGSKGANGVIAVTTKQGREGKLSVSFRHESKISMPTQLPQMVDGVTYMRMYNEAQYNDNPVISPRYTAQKIQNTISGINPMIYPNIDWYNEMFKKLTYNQHYTLNANGGGKVARYYMAVTYDKDTGILKENRTNNFKNNIDINRYKIQLYCNQVFVTDSVEGIVPDFLMLLQGVIDSPDIPLNVSRSYLQSDSNVKKISGYITKKVAERLQEIFNSDRKQFEEKWDDLKIFIEYGMLSDEKFYERAQKFVLLKDTEDKYYTLEEYKKLIEGNQTDKDGQLIYLYATDKEAQYSYIETATSKGYDVLLMNGQLDPHFIGMLEQKLGKCRFVRVDSDLIDRLIQKSDNKSSVALNEQQRDVMTTVFKSQIPVIEKSDFLVMFEPVGATAQPIVITQNEFMRRMKDMAAIQPGMAIYGELPDSYNLIVNTEHPLTQRIIADTESSCKEQLTPILDELNTVNAEISRLQEAKKDKKDEEIPVADKEALKSAEEKAKELRAKESDVLKSYADKNPLVRQLVDLALLSNNMLKGEALSNFIKRSVEIL